MNVKVFALAVVSNCCLYLTTASATPVLATANLDAAQEPGGTSDSLALGAAVLSVDPVTGIFDFSMEVTGIGVDDLADLGISPEISSVHIHTGSAGINGPLAIDLGGGNTNTNVTPFTNNGFSLNIEGGFFGGLLGNDLAAANTNLAALLTNDLYINIHTNDFLGGEIRGQLGVVQQQVIPEPASLALLGMGMIGVALKRRRR